MAQKQGKKEVCPKFAFLVVKSQNFHILYKIIIKNWNVLHIVSRFYSKLNKFEVSRAFSVFVGQIEAPAEIVSELFQPQISEFWEPWLSDKLKYTRQLVVSQTMTEPSMH